MPSSARSTAQLSEHTRLLRCVQGIQERCSRAAPWEPDTVGLPDPTSPSALSRINDVAFYAHARDEVSALAAVCAHLVRLHHPDREEHCASCSGPWPCATFTEIARLLS
ncbi:hypothetical protein [Nocardiopsis salina]|uniref:hypothetical protein n=1 Tax=Nocardiopsis salina TaxID=245836 RepID=UPI00034DDCD7|nr:hypothetical protein [Nocardiopsis salina]